MRTFEANSKLIDRLTRAFIIWGQRDGVKEVWQHMPVTFGHFDSDFITFDHHTSMGETDYLTVTCGGECGSRWTFDLEIEAGTETNITAISVNESGYVAEYVSHVIGVLGRAADGKHFGPSGPTAATKPAASSEADAGHLTPKAKAWLTRRQNASGGAYKALANALKIAPVEPHEEAVLKALETARTTSATDHPYEVQQAIQTAEIEAKKLETVHPNIRTVLNAWGVKV